jgi:hypothetical protein
LGNLHRTKRLWGNYVEKQDYGENYVEKLDCGGEGGGNYVQKKENCGGNYVEKQDYGGN